MPTLSTHYIDFEEVASLYEYQYPAELELLEIFPESKQLVPRKLREWRKAKREIVATETEPYLKLCNALTDPFSIAFWKEAYAYMAGAFRECCAHVERLERLKAIMGDPAGYRATRARLEAARLTKMNDLYQFRALRRSGRGFQAICPLHGDSDASFHIYPNNSFHCFGCGKSGDSITFVRILHGLGFSQAVNYILGGK